MPTERAWTLGYPPAYEPAIRIPGNAKQPGGYAFKTREDALDYKWLNPNEAGRYEPYEMQLPMKFEWCIETDAEGKTFLTCEAPLINPDTGQPA